MSRPSHGDQSIDFANPEPAKLLNQALLKHYNQVAFWDIPADYLLYMADLPADSYGEIPTGENSFKTVIANDKRFDLLLSWRSV